MRTILFSIFIILNCICLQAQKINTSLAYVVNKPAVVNPKTPVVIILHGYGSNEHDSRDMAKTLSEKCIVFSLRAPIFLKTGGSCWFNMDFLEWKNFKSNYGECIDSKKKILSFVSNACRAYKVDSTQVFLLGFSQGGMMAYETAVEAPGKIKGVIALSTRMMEETIVRHDANWEGVKKVKFYIVGGYSDATISFLDAYKAHDILKNKGVHDLTLKLYDIPHTITPDEIQDMKSWLNSKVALKG